MKKKYKVTGLYAYSTRYFKAIHTDNYIHAMGINLWCGSVWQMRDNGTWKRIKEVIK